jgi:hypothetical protein
MPIPLAEARQFRVATLSQKKFESPDFMIKPHIVGFLAKVRACIKFAFALNKLQLDIPLVR